MNFVFCANKDESTEMNKKQFSISMKLFFSNNSKQIEKSSKKILKNHP